MTQINFAQLLKEHQGAGDPPPDGIYDTVCTKAEARTASTGKPMIVASFRVLTGPEANKVIVNNFVLTQENPNAFWFFVRHMAVFGIDQAMLAQVTDLNQLAPHLVNKQARLTIQKQAGRNLPNVTGVEPVPGGMLSAAPQVQPNGGITPQYPQSAPLPGPTPTPTYQQSGPTPGYDQAGLIPQQPQGETVLPPQVQQDLYAQAQQSPIAPAPQPPGPQLPPQQEQEPQVPQAPQVPF